jgi:hypothetical protein
MDQILSSSTSGQVLKPLQDVGLMYWNFGVKIFWAIPIQYIIGLPVIVVLVFLLWFWYNFLR